jgi:uncharacterized cupredoxin-like copper-binding protein
MLMTTLVAALAACMETSAPPPAPQLIEVPVTLAEFTITVPAQFQTLAVGQTYRFVVRNTGQLEHEFMVMPRGEMDKTKALLMIDEDELAPGKVVQHEYTFTRAGEYELACHLGRHYELGMVQPILVTSK